MSIRNNHAQKNKVWEPLIHMGYNMSIEKWRVTTSLGFL